MVPLQIQFTYSYDTDSAYRIPEAEILGNATQEQNREYPFYIPRIPCHPVGYGIAVKLME